MSEETQICKFTFIHCILTHVFNVGEGGAYVSNIQVLRIEISKGNSPIFLLISWSTVVLQI